MYIISNAKNLDFGFQKDKPRKGRIGSEEIYIVVKSAVYNHGVFYIGSDKELAIEKAIFLAKNDIDSHHDYEVQNFKEIELPYTVVEHGGK